MRTDHRINHEIRVPKVTVIGNTGSNLGEMDTRDAISMAKSLELDLVEVAPKARPPVCRIIDYGKFKYDQSKREKKQKSPETKTVQIKPQTEFADLERKAVQANEFLEKGHPVIVTLRMRGREQAHPDIWIEKVQDFVDHLTHGSLSPISRNGRVISMSVKPKEQA